MPTAIEPQLFVSVVRPLLETNNISGLIDAIQRRWNCAQICRLATHGETDARKVALLCIGMVGDTQCVETVATQLQHTDPTVNQMAEHALWSIWCRAGSPDANERLARGSKAVQARLLDQAIEHFDQAIEIDRDFAEAYNQRSIARFMQDDYDRSIADSRKAVRLMPFHFGALAGMGHCFLHLGQLDHALRAYERALAINPHLSCVRQTAGEIRNRLGG